MPSGESDLSILGLEGILRNFLAILSGRKSTASLRDSIVFHINYAKSIGKTKKKKYGTYKLVLASIMLYAIP